MFASTTRASSRARTRRGGPRRALRRAAHLVVLAAARRHPARGRLPGPVAAGAAPVPARRHAPDAGRARRLAPGCTTRSCTSAPARDGSPWSTTAVSRWGSTSRCASRRPSTPAAPSRSSRCWTRSRRSSEALRKAGIEPFLAYGTLLGAVREGKLIGHDSDADLGYVSRHTPPGRRDPGVVRAAARVWPTWATRSPATAASRSRSTSMEADGSIRGLDVFGGFLSRGRLPLPDGRDRYAVRARLDLPARHHHARGPRAARRRPTPTRFLTATYGPSWRVPDPAYMFETPRGHPAPAQRLVPRHPRQARGVGPHATPARRSSRTWNPARSPAGCGARRPACRSTSSTSAAARGVDALLVRPAGRARDRPGLRAAGQQGRRRTRRGAGRGRWSSGDMNLCELRSVLGRQRAAGARARAARSSSPATSPTRPTRSGGATCGGPARRWPARRRPVLPGVPRRAAATGDPFAGRNHLRTLPVELVTEELEGRGATVIAQRTKQSGDAPAQRGRTGSVDWWSHGNGEASSCAAGAKPPHAAWASSAPGAGRGRRALKDRVAVLEEEVQECRQLNLRLAELTDVVQELLLPVAAARREPASRRSWSATRRACERPWREGLLPRRPAQDRHDVPADRPVGQPRRAAPPGRAAARLRPAPAPVGQRRRPRGPAPGPPRPGGASTPGRSCAARSTPGTAPRCSATSSSPAPTSEQAAARWPTSRGAEVHVVLTARDPLGLVTARWQEIVKNGATPAIDDYSPRPRAPSPHDEWDWRTLDLRLVLERWAPMRAAGARARADAAASRAAARSRCGSGSRTWWASTPARFDVSGSHRTSRSAWPRRSCCGGQRRPRPDFGSAVRPRRVHPQLPRRRAARAAPGREVLARAGADRASCRARGEAAVAHIEAAGYDVIGDVQDLLPRRTCPSGGTGRLGHRRGDAGRGASATIAAMMTDVRRLTRQRDGRAGRSAKRRGPGRHTPWPRSR